MFTAVDLFCGAGGLSTGLEMAGFETRLASDIHPVYASTFEANHPQTPLLTSDIRDVSNQSLLELSGLEPGELDLLAGGPPCQGFSVNAPVRSELDPRNHLFLEYLRAVKVFDPKFVLIENVPGIVSFNGGKVIEAIYESLEKLGYSVSHKILFAGHFGVPQMRFRTVFLAGKNSVPIFPEPSHNSQAVANFSGAKELCQKVHPLFSSHLEPQVSVGQVFGDLPTIDHNKKGERFDYIREPANEFQKFLRRNNPTLNLHHCAKLAEINKRRLNFIPQGGSWRDIPYDLLPDGLKRARRSDHTKRYGRLHPDQLCSTILTKCDPHWGSFFHPYEDRVISVREAARIQSFPDNYIFLGSTTQQYEQIGNAVPPLMAKAIGDNLAKEFEGVRFEQATG